MSKGTQQMSFKLAGLISKSRLFLFTGLFVGIALSGGPSKAYAADPSADAAAQPKEVTRSPGYQQRVMAVHAAEDRRDRESLVDAREAQLQEQARVEELELRRIRADRIKQRADRAAAAAAAAR